MSHIFISYSNKDAKYAKTLAQNLIEKGFDVWIDDRRLQSSVDWWQSIVVAIWECSAFIVILSPNSDKSRWVQREISIADDRSKPIFPLLLDGDLNTPNWQLFIRTQYEDVRSQELPDSQFYAFLSQVIVPKESPGREVNTMSTPKLAPAEKTKLENEIADPPPMTAIDYLDRGVEHYELDNNEAALADYDRALELDPDYSDAYHNRGLVYDKMGDHLAAIADYTRVIELNPNDAQEFNNRGISYSDLQDHEKALEDYSRAIELDPAYGDAYNNRGSAQFELGNYDQALADYSRALELDPDHADTYNSRGLVYEELEDYQQALAEYNHAIELDPEYSDAYSNRGNVHEILGDTEAAIKDYNQAIETDPEYADPHWGLGNIYYDQQDYASALASYRRYVELSPEPDRFVLNRIDALAERLGE